MEELVGVPVERRLGGPGSRAEPRRSHEGPRRRRRRPRARPRLAARAEPHGRPSSSPRRATPGSRARRPACRSPPTTSAASCAAVERERIDLTVVGPEAPLVAGLADELEARGHPVFGPTRDAARIEGSKAWAKELCERHGIPAARSRTFTDAGSGASDFVDELGAGARRRQGRRPGGRQGRDRRARPRGGREPPSRPRLVDGVVRRRGLARGGRGVPGGPRGLGVRAHRRPRRAAARASRRTSSARARATRAPTPAAWAPTSPLAVRRPRHRAGDLERRRARDGARRWRPRACATGGSCTRA